METTRRSASESIFPILIRRSRRCDGKMECARRRVPSEAPPRRTAYISTMYVQWTFSPPSAEMLTYAAHAGTRWFHGSHWLQPKSAV